MTCPRFRRTGSGVGASRVRDLFDQAKRNSGENFSEKLQDVIENSDRDAAVYSDAEGAGSQGRPNSAPPEEKETEEKRPIKG